FLRASATERSAPDPPNSDTPDNQMNTSTPDTSDETTPQSCPHPRCCAPIPGESAYARIPPAPRPIPRQNRADTNIPDTDRPSATARPLPSPDPQPSPTAPPAHQTPPNPACGKSRQCTISAGLPAGEN